MSYSNLVQHAAYKAAQYNVSKTRQVVMLYDGALRFIKKAIQSIQDKNIQERYNNLEKASKIIMGLQSSLDFDKGGDVSQVLDQYYHSIDMRIIRAQRSNNIESLEQIMKEIHMMREAWDEVDKISSSMESQDSNSQPSEQSSGSPVAQSGSAAYDKGKGASGLSLDI